MKPFFKIAVLLGFFVLAACSRVPAGNVGVKVYLLGGAKGVDVETLSPGKYWIGWNEDLFIFPTFTQNYTWAADPESPTRAIGFQTSEGLSVSADIGISYSIDPAKVPLVFQKYRKGVDEITDIYLRNMVRDALVTKTSSQPIETVYGRGKSDLIAEVEKAVRDQVSPIGINVERIYWVGEVQLPETVKKALNAKIEATQKAQQRENEVAQAKAEADKTIAEARGSAESTLLRAKAEAESIRIKGEALRQNSGLVELTVAEKWDGKLPVNMYGGGAVPFINLNGGR
ncbi:prohibitin family protein [Nevskia ramosa]|uniref:prohibitin family protein n=1 Tax=Nevskia ramosa TaxID=64002 RepID=UPI003D0A88C7